MSLNAIVRHYERYFRPRAQRELDWFRSQPNLAAAIHNAAMSVDERNCRYSHQSRRKRETLVCAAKRLGRHHDEIAACSSFVQLHKLIRRVLENLNDAGPLYKYDVALRIGAFLGYLPREVYLHSGTKQGALALGLNVELGFLLMSDLPAELRVLAPHEVEDVLCIYKDHFGPVLSGYMVDLPDDVACFRDDDSDD